jgi:AcrR family transcriptional regulator
MSVNKKSATYETQRTAAAQNRKAILSAAHDLFAVSPTVSLNEIAIRAGVGAGTLYRHFPTREDLILAVYRRDIELLVAGVDSLLAANLASKAFVVWFETLADYIRIKHGLGEALYNAAIRDAINETYAPVVRAVGKLLEACAAEGTLRPGLLADDVLLLMGFLWRVGPGDSGREQGRRIVQMVFDGIGRPDKTSP